MALPELNQVLILLINILGVALGVAVFLQNPRDTVNRLFAVMILFMLTWVNFAYIPRIIGHENAVLALVLLKIAWFATPPFFTFLYFLATFLTGSQYKYRPLHFTIGILGLGIGFLTGFTNLVVESLGFREGAVRINYGDAMWPFLGIITLIIASTIFITYRGYFGLPQNRKLQLQYFIAGLSIFYVANLIFNISLPIFFDIVRWYWIGDYSTLIVLSLTGYAIVKQELFGIRVILTSLLVALIILLLAVDTIIYTEDLPAKFAKGITLIIFIYFAYLLIRSVHREIRQREELQSLTKRLEAANVELKRLDRAKSEFVSIASHQLRTPLTAIKGYLSLALGGSYGKFPERAQKPIAKVYESNERLIRLVNDLLSLSRIESGKMELELQRADLTEIIQSVVDELQVKARQKDLKLSFQKSATALPSTWLDKEKIRNVILNIVDNAIRYTEKGSIQVKQAKSENTLLLSVADTGEGMTKEEIARLFESFSRGQAGQKLATEGAGLGLYIARQFARMHGGRVWAESPGKGKGSTFFITLPFRRGRQGPGLWEKV